MTAQIKKINPINFQAHQYSPSRKQQFYEDFKNQIADLNANPNLTPGEYLSRVEMILVECYSPEYGQEQTEHHFDHIPGDTRFPANLNSLADHLLFTAAVIQLISNQIIITYGVKSIQELNMLFFEGEILTSNISIEDFLTLGRLIGLLHDLEKPKLDHHAENSANRVETWFQKSLLPPDILAILVQAIKNHHSDSSRVLDMIVRVADWIATGDRSPYFDFDFFHLFLTKYPKDNTLYSAQFPTNVSQLNVDDLVDEKVKSKYAEYPIFKTKYQQIKDDSIITKLEEIAKKISKKGLSLTRETKDKDEDFLLQPRFCFFYVEFKSIQKFIFASSKLKYIQNASALIEKLFQKALLLYSQEAGRETIVFCGGGNLLGIIPKQQFGVLKSKIMQMLDEQGNISAHFQISGLEHPFTLGELVNGSKIFWPDLDDVWASVTQLTTKNIRSSTMDKAKAYLAYLNLNPFTFSSLPLGVKKAMVFERYIQKKNFGELVSFFLSNQIPETIATSSNVNRFPNQILCQHCQNAPATEQIKDRDESYFVCENCNLVLHPPKPPKTPSEGANDVLTALQDHVIRKVREDIGLNLRSIDSNDDLGDYIALIKLDGNNIGALKSQLSTWAGYRAFSETLDYQVKRIIENVWIKLIRDRPASFQHNLFLPFFPIIIGGDDLTLICRAEFGLPFLQAFFEEVESYFGRPRLLQGLFSQSVSQSQPGTSSHNGSNPEIRLYDLMPKATEFTSEGSQKYLYNLEYDSDKSQFFRKIPLGSPINFQNINEFKSSLSPIGYSGGILFFPKKTPLNRIFDLADNLEHRAKQYIKGQIAAFEAQGLRAIGAWNSIAGYYSTTNDLSLSYLSDYYGENITQITDCTINPRTGEHPTGTEIAYLDCLFPLNSIEFSFFLQEISHIRQMIDSGKLARNTLKQKARQMADKSPHVNLLELYYTIGKIHKDSSRSGLDEYYEKILKIMLNRISVKSSPVEIFLNPLNDLTLYDKFYQNLKHQK